MAVPGNLTTIDIVDADLEARRVALHRYRDPSASDWSNEIAKGKEDALSEFVSVRGEDPLRVVPVYEDQWKRVLAYFTLSLIFQSFQDDTALEEAARWRGTAHKTLVEFRYNLDSDEDDSLSTGEQDRDYSPEEVSLRR